MTHFEKLIEEDVKYQVNSKIWCNETQKIPDQVGIQVRSQVGFQVMVKVWYQVTHLVQDQFRNHSNDTF